MKQNEVFGNAEWISAKTGYRVPVLRKNFEARAGERATLRIIGLGTFVCYINKRRVSEDYFLPLCSKYDSTTHVPVGEELSGYRTYVTEIDVTEYLREGKNALSVMLGEGWYTELRYYGIHHPFNEKKAIFRLTVGDREYLSDETVRYTESYILRSGLHEGGEMDFSGWTDDVFSPEYDDTGWGSVNKCLPPDTEYCFTDCPPDRIMRKLPVRPVFSGDNYKIYDVGENISGYPVVISCEGYVGEINITYSECLREDGRELDGKHIFGQHIDARVDGVPREIYPRFTWFGFRYFKVVGEADCREAMVVHSAVEVNSSFESSSDTLNWIYGAFIKTQLANMHRGIPSDCPHLEREGYTGDGQLVARSVMHTLAAREFYAKWIDDILDSQDKITGRVQYTAPVFIDSGGGPGGWGCAIAVVPYEYYKYYGDDSYLRKLYPGMLRFLDFLCEHSESELVTSFKEERWCLGDWCAPERAELPAPFVNTYFRVYTLELVIKIARIIGREDDISRLESEANAARCAINKFYFNDFRSDDTYLANYRGAGAFALGIGLGTDVTKRKLIEYYDRLGYYDTGIFGTELVTRRLFELGRADVAYKLLTASEPHGFGKWRELGATTLLEYWTLPSRSHSHPMFGAVTSLLFEYILGIRQTEESAGFCEVVIAPEVIEGLDAASGHITTPRGKISVKYSTRDGVRTYSVSVPDGVRAHLKLFGDAERVITGGEYSTCVDLK